MTDHDVEKVVESILVEYEPTQQFRVIMNATAVELRTGHGHINGAFHRVVARDTRKVLIDTVWVLGTLKGMRRLAVLVHQLGHYESALRNRTEEYEDATKDGQSIWVDQAQKGRAVLEEELVAWEVGLEIARRHGLENATELLEIAREAFERYRDKVVLPAGEFDTALAKLGETLSQTP